MAEKKENPLTLKELAKYNQEVLFPYFHKTFVKKKDFDNFKNKSLSKLDKILEGVVPLKREKVMKDLQDKNQKKALEIHNSALKKSKILTEQEVSEINNLRVF